MTLVYPPSMAAEPERAPDAPTLSGPASQAIWRCMQELTAREAEDAGDAELMALALEHRIGAWLDERERRLVERLRRLRAYRSGR